MLSQKVRVGLRVLGRIKARIERQNLLRDAGPDLTEHKSHDIDMKHENEGSAENQCQLARNEMKTTNATVTSLLRQLCSGNFVWEPFPGSFHCRNEAVKKSLPLYGSRVPKKNHRIGIKGNTT